MTTAIQTIDVKSFIQTRASEFQKVIPSHMSPDRMMRIALSAISTTPHLSECTIQSVAISLMGCSSLGLEPNTPTGHAYLIPYKCPTKNEKGEWVKQWRCQLVVGYKGYIELFYRSGVVSKVKAFPVYEGDTFQHTMGTDEKLVHVASDSQDRENPDKLIKAYCVIKMKDLDEPMIHVMSRADIDRHMERTQSRDFKTKKITGPWVTDFVKMALKTTVRDIVPWVPFSIERPEAVRPAAAAAFEFANERRLHLASVDALGPDAQEVTRGLLEGIPQDDEAIDGEVVEGGAMEQLKEDLKKKREPGQEG